VVAVWPRLGLLTSVVHQIDILLKLNQEVVCVINKSEFSDEWSKSLGQFPITILIRENIGRDFGAYQKGFNYISEEFGLSNIDRLTFTNDTILFAKDSINVIRDTLSLDGDVNSIYLNLQGYLHAQSFFISFSKEVIESKHFLRFWQQYYPSNERTYVIKKGERKLSQILQNANFKFKSYVSTQRLIEIFSDYKPFTVSELRSCYELDGDTSKIRKYFYLRDDYHKLQAQRAIISRNASHVLGLYLFRVNSVPLKIDLMKRSYNTASDFHEILFAKGYSLEELSDLEWALYNIGSWTTLRGIEFLWRRYDFI
jgi:hypothetical protein